jgi:hypothetical protein
MLLFPHPMVIPSRGSTHVHNPKWTPETAKTINKNKQQTTNNKHQTTNKQQSTNKQQNNKTTKQQNKQTCPSSCFTSLSMICITFPAPPSEMNLSTHDSGCGRNSAAKFTFFIEPTV